jgi:hypothetical protein
MTPPPLQAIAREKNWMEFALLLDAAMAEPARYGLDDAFAVRATVARMRRQLPSSLVGAVKAVRYLRQRRPDVLAGRDASIGCANVRLLERIASVSPAAAAEVEPRVLGGAIRTADLRARYAALRRERRERPAEPAARRRV